MTIICYKCNIEKECDNFFKNKRKKQGFSSICKECQKIYMTQYRLDNVEKIKNLNKRYKIENKDYLKEKDKIYTRKNKEKIRKYQKEYKENNKEKINKLNRERRKATGYEKNRRQYKNEWVKNDRRKRPWYYAHRDLLNRLVRNLYKKKKSTIKELGYSDIELKESIELLFLDGMSWENYGEWHIDHKIPLSLFKIDDPASVVNALSNLQPLWKEDNLRKYNKLD